MTTIRLLKNVHAGGRSFDSSHLDKTFWAGTSYRASVNGHGAVDILWAGKSYGLFVGEFEILTPKTGRHEHDPD